MLKVTDTLKDVQAESQPNPTQDTPVTFERSQRIANALEQLSRVQAMEATPYTVKQALVHAFAEGGWRHGFRLMPERLIADAQHARVTEIHLLTSGGRRMKITTEYED
jgi:hypothetical protein